MRSSVLALIIVLGGGLGSAGVASSTVTIDVRFIDARSGRPYTQDRAIVTIFLYKTFGPGHGFRTLTEARANDAGTLREALDSRSEIHVTLPNPPPRFMAMASFVGCGPGLFDISEVIAKGAVGKNECRTKFAKQHVSFRAKPGEIIYFVAPLSFWDRHPLIR